MQVPSETSDKKPSGQLRLRLPVDLHAALATEAERQGVSLNTLMVGLLGGRIPRRPSDASGQLRLRLPVERHAALAAEAERQGVSLNTLMVGLLGGGISWRASD